MQNIRVNMSLVQKPEEENDPSHKSVLLCLVQTHFQSSQLMIFIRKILTC